MGALIVVRLVADLDLHLQCLVNLACILNRIAKLASLRGARPSLELLQHVTEWDGDRLTAYVCLLLFDKSISHLHCVKEGNVCLSRGE